VISNVAAAAASLAAVFLLTRLLAAQGYGLYAAVLGLGTIVQTFGYLAVQSSITRFYAAAKDGEERYRLASAVRVAFVASTAAVLAAYWAAMLWLGDAGVTGGIALAGAALLVLRGWFNVVQAWNRAEGRPWAYCLLEAGQAFGSLLLTVAALQLAPGRPDAALWGGALAILIAAGCTPRLLLAPLRVQGTGPLMREVAAYGGPLMLVNLAGALLAVSDRLIVAVHAGAAAAGAYAVAFAIADRAMHFALLPVPLAVKPALFAAWERGGASAARPLLERSARALILVGLPTATLLAFAALPITRLLAGGGMAEDAAQVLPWLTAGSLLSGLLTLHFAVAFQLTRRTRPMIFVLGVPALLNIAANLLLVPRYGMISAGWTTVGCYGLALALAVLLGRREASIPFPLKTLGWVAAGCAVLALALSRWVPE
jgi:O-antigen/teichoic acid export membrane protein